MFVTICKSAHYSKNNKLLFYFILIFAWSLSSCYSFKGISIPVNADTFYVEQFDVQDQDALPEIGLIFTEKLKDKIRQESRLKLTETDSDYEFSGAITGYDVTAEAPKAGEETAFNRLTITVSVEFVNNNNEKDSWNHRFPYFLPFDTAENLIDVQENLVEDILNQIVEEIFNKAFTNW